MNEELHVAPVKLTPKQEKFCTEYLVDLNATQAATRAGYSAKTAGAIGFELLKKPQIQSQIEINRVEVAKTTGITPERVLQELGKIAFADHNELSEHRRVCCRHCYGIANGYQRTTRELAALRKAYEAKLEGLPTDKLLKEPPFDEQGGSRFDPRHAPNPDCPECFGLGNCDVFIHDTRRLSPEGRALYAGVKRSRAGIEVKAHDKLAAIEKIMRHLGMFSDKSVGPDATLIPSGTGGFTGTLEELLITLRKVTISSKPDSGCGD
jgi:phage terminase small subunit